LNNDYLLIIFVIMYLLIILLNY